MFKLDLLWLRNVRKPFFDNPDDAIDTIDVPSLLGFAQSFKI
ncbi:hypothetical protein [Marinobacter piscensis]|nr:hypothetical protein [Marinobacter piscensis]